MDRFSFTLQVEGLDPKHEEYEDLLYQAGCEDALVAVIDGTIFVDFDREAFSYDGAVAAARMDIEKAGGQVVKALPLQGDSSTTRHRTAFR